MRISRQVIPLIQVAPPDPAGALHPLPPRHEAR
jgi:hypothetical protein